MNSSSHMSWSEGLRLNLYALEPSETYYDHVSKVPDLVHKALPVTFALFAIEAIILWATGHKEKWRIHNAVVNLSCSGASEAFTSFIFRGAEMSFYIWLHDNLRITTLPWDSAWTYVFAVFAVDFVTYWWHRASHETAFLWSHHYVHHSSEDFNMTLGARDPVIQRLIKRWAFMPLACLGLPAQSLVVHLQLNNIFPFLTHCELVPKLNTIVPVIGHVIEFFLVTPSHHRVHHGSNQYCIDKNYGQVLIIWDRMFGTYADEKDGEDIVYGTLGGDGSYDIIGLQIRPVVDMWKKFQSMSTIGDKFRAVFYGPGWFPGTARLGNPEDIPDVRGRKKSERSYPWWFSIYMIVHCSVVFYSYAEMVPRLDDLQSSWIPFLNLVYILVSFTSLGGLYDMKHYSKYLEPTRLVLFHVLISSCQLIGSPAATAAIGWLNFASLFMCPSLSTYIKHSHLGNKSSKIKHH